MQEHKLLSALAMKTYHNTGLKYYYPDGISYEIGKLLTVKDIDVKYKSSLYDIEIIVRHLSQLKSGVVVGDGYVSFYYAGDIFSTDEFYVNSYNDKWLNNFRNDNVKYGLNISNIKQIESNWYLIVVK